MNDVIISGSSNTSGAWPTWLDLSKELYSANFIDVSKKGLGNEAIITRAVHTAYQKNKNSSSKPLIIIMLTSIDKWDWYVDRPDLVDKFSKEKHTLTKLTPNAPGGFWSTGAWFPLEKEYFKNNYYSQEYFTFKSLQHLMMFKHLCIIQNWSYLILFDSPIWSITEIELYSSGENNLKLDIWSNKLVNNELCNWMFELSNIKNETYLPGLIGFLQENNLPWYTNKYLAHPGTAGHYEFAKKHVFPFLDSCLAKRNLQYSIEDYVKKMDLLWMQ